VLPKSRDSLMQERMEDLRAALEAQPQPKPTAHGGRPMTMRKCMEAEETAQPQPEPVAWMPATHSTFGIGDMVRKVRGSQWRGRVVGWYSTGLTPEGYAVESANEAGSVQIYPAVALELWSPTPMFHFERE